MAISANILAPRVIALAAVGYCLWPSLTAFMSETASKPPAKVAALETGLLAPKMPPLPARDPFQVKAEPVANAPAKSAANKSKLAAHEAVKKPIDPLEGLTLDATCIVGNQRLAVINGRLYAAPELLLESSSATSPPKIVNVLPYKVLLEWGGKTLELTYSNVASSAAASRDTDVHGGPNGITTGRARGSYAPSRTRATAEPAGAAAPESER